MTTLETGRLWYLIRTCSETYSALNDSTIALDAYIHTAMGTYLHVPYTYSFASVHESQMLVSHWAGSCPFYLLAVNLCRSQSLMVCLFIHLSVCPSMCLSLSLLPACPLVNRSVCLTVWVIRCFAGCMSVCLSICLLPSNTVYLHVFHWSVCLSIGLSLYLSAVAKVSHCLSVQIP